ncbi:MAG: LysR substrate-binding domain-containing protein [Candidatus Rokuibacteriota bacterium]
MAINLNQLRALDAVGRTGSFSKAARDLSVTQPAITAHIRQLEQHCGVPLFDRVRRRSRLTEAGQTLFQYAQRIFALAGEAEEALDLARQFRAGRLRLVASLTSAAYYLPPLIAAFRAHYPEIQITLFVDNSQRVAERIVDLRDHLGMLSGPAPHPSLVLEPWYEDPVVLVVAPQHPWARRSSVSLRELHDQLLILREPGSATRALIEERMAAQGVAMKITMELGSNEAVKRMVEMGHGVTLISAAVVRREVDAGQLALVTLRERGWLRRYYLAYHRDRRESPLIQAMLDVARKTLGRPAAAPAGSRRGP